MSARPTLATYGLTTLIALVIANMIGAGVFTTSGFSLADLHTPQRVVAAWVVAGLIALCGAIAYGALASVLHESGGEYLFLSRWVHPAVGFLAGWVSLLAGFTGAIAFAARTLEVYLFPSHGWLASGAILLAAGLHGIRKAPGAWAQNGIVGAKIVLLGLLLAIAFTQTGWQGGPLLDQEGLVPAFSLGKFAESLMWISLSYSGFNAAIYVAGEARSPSLVPRALIIGTLITMLLYVALNTIFVYAPVPTAIAGQPEVALITGKALGNSFLEKLIRVVIPLALFTSVSAMMLAGPRVYARMADDGVLPRWLRFQGETPWRAILLQALLAILLVWLASIRELLSYLGFTLSLSSAAAVSSLFLVHRRRLAEVATYQRIAAGIYVGMTLFAASLGAYLNPKEGFAGLATLGTGYALYRLIEQRRRSH
ncbi:MAG: amino acid transporter [Verrucomicrobiales bacterium]